MLLPRSRGAVEADDGRLEVAAQLQDGEVLQYALLHFLHAVVVLVQYALGALDVQVVLGVLVPGQGDHGLQVGELHAVLGALGIEHLQLVQLLHEGGVHLLGPLLGLGLLVELLALGAAVVVAQLLLDVLQLLLQEVLALLGVQVVAGLLPYLLLQAQQADVPVLELQYLVDAVHQGVRGEQVHLLLGAEGHVGADEVGEHHLVGDVLQGELGLVGYAVVRLDILYGLLPQLRQQGVELGVSLLGYLLLDGLDGRRVVGANTPSRYMSSRVGLSTFSSFWQKTHSTGSSFFCSIRIRLVLCSLPTSTGLMTVGNITTLRVHSMG